MRERRASRREERLPGGLLERRKAVGSEGMRGVWRCPGRKLIMSKNCVAEMWICSKRWIELIDVKAASWQICLNWRCIISKCGWYGHVNVLCADMLVDNDRNWHKHKNFGEMDSFAYVATANEDIQSIHCWQLG